jgi:glycosyltransferase involved in cell wall biosynthesis
VRDGQVVFLNSAGMNPDRKGTDVVLAAYTKALEHGLENTKLVIHSQRPLLEYKWRDPRTAGLLKDLLGRERVEVIERSFVNPRDVYAFGDICLYPARFDGMGLTIAEANACALPVITADHAPWNEFVTRENGSLIGCTRVYRTERSFHPFVEPDADALASEIILWSTRDVAAAKNAAREYARRHFDWEANATPLGKHLENAPLLEKAGAIRAAAEYEKSRRRTVREKISFNLPSVVKTARRSYRLAVGRS